MNFVAFIFARGGSKGLPGKNVKCLAGKPLLAWSIDHAKSVKRIARVIVSTDSEEIAAVAKEFGAEVPFLRPAELAGDHSSEWLAWQHGLRYLQENDGKLPDAMVSLPATAPLRISDDVERCLDVFSEGGTDMVITVTAAHRNPWFNMVKERGDGLVELVNGGWGVVRRQDAPQVFDIATVAYVASPQFVLSQKSMFAGRVKAVQVPPERAIDIDTAFDFELAEYLMNKKGKSCVSD